MVLTCFGRLRRSQRSMWLSIGKRQQNFLWNADLQSTVTKRSKSVSFLYTIDLLLNFSSGKRKETTHGYVTHHDRLAIWMSLQFQEHLGDLAELFFGFYGHSTAL